MVQFCNKMFENFSSHRLQMFENSKPSSGCVRGPLFPATPHSRPGQGRGQSAGLDPSPLPCHSQLPTAEVLACLQRALVFSHSPAILPQDNGVSMHVSYILLLGKWSRVAWAEAYEGWGVPSPFRWEEAGDMARREEVSVSGGQTGGPQSLPWPLWCSLSWPPIQGRQTFIC